MAKVLKAVDAVNFEIFDAIVGADALDQAGLDRNLIKIKTAPKIKAGLVPMRSLASPWLWLGRPPIHPKCRFGAILVVSMRICCQRQ